MYTRVRRYGIMVLILGVLVAAGYWWYATARTVELRITDPNQVLPDQITLVRGVRDTLVVTNASTVPITVAGTTLVPGQQFRQYYRSTGEYAFACSVHTGQTLRVVVRDP